MAMLATALPPLAIPASLGSVATPSCQVPARPVSALLRGLPSKGGVRRYPRAARVPTPASEGPSPSVESRFCSRAPKLPHCPPPSSLDFWAHGPT